MLTLSSTRAALGALMGGLSLAAITSACSDQGPGGAGDASISFQIASSAAASLNATALGSDVAAIIIEGGGHSVDLESADVVFGDVVFKGVDDDDDDDEDMDDDNCDRGILAHGGGDDDDCKDDDDEDDFRFNAGPITVSLPLEGGMITPFNGPLPPGTFDRLKMKADFVRVQGTFDGQAFDVTVEVRAELDFELDPPIEVTEDSDIQNVSVDIDVASWFKDAAGNAIDPRLIPTNEQLRNEFRRRVARSFHAFGDDDCDGHRDKGDRSGSNSGPG